MNEKGQHKETEERDASLPSLERILQDAELLDAEQQLMLATHLIQSVREKISLLSGKKEYGMLENVERRVLEKSDNGWDIHESLSSDTADDERKEWE